MGAAGVGMLGSGCFIFMVLCVQLTDLAVLPNALSPPSWAPAPEPTYTFASGISFAVHIN